MAVKTILRKKKLFIFDMDGTIYLGNRVFPFAVDFINRLRADGRRVLFFTNNASHSPEFYMDKLNAKGFSPREGELLTSADVTLRFLHERRAGKSVYLVGTPQLEGQFAASGISLLKGDEDKADIVVTSFDTTLTYAKLEAACRFVRNGAEYLSTHPDFNCPTETGFIPDSGAIAALVTASTGVEPRYFGKPYPMTLELICDFTGVNTEDMVIFGDRLYTDIALGRRGGVTAVLVLTGETTMEMVNTAEGSDRPDIILESLAEADEIIFG
ncbi:MAG: HAD-IIA family hydrolase [Clostridiales bacterium]|nr:HAD-IIA family hydrolase [Clostridiales bacterium]